MTYHRNEVEPEEVHAGVLEQRAGTSMGAYTMLMSELPAAGNGLDPSERAVVEDDGLVEVVRRLNMMPKRLPERFHEGSDYGFCLSILG